LTPGKNASKKKPSKASKKTTGMFDRMQRVVARIPRGRVATYGDIAYAAGYPGAARQAAWALHGSRGLPWQRVVGAGGRILLTGHAGLEQRLRLQSEGVKFSGLRVDIKRHRCEFKVLRPSRKRPKG
jgi:methylated-DNA-protein-cysteine methyltransferase-like protein